MSLTHNEARAVMEMVDNYVEPWTLPNKIICTIGPIVIVVLIALLATAPKNIS